MLVRDLMTPDPTVSPPEALVQDVARLMWEADVGEIPIVSSLAEPRLVGVITDRDIACRVVATGQDASMIMVSKVMSSPVVSVDAGMDAHECQRLMRRHQVRRLPVVDARGHVCGIVSQADLARGLPVDAIGEVVRDVSRDAKVTRMSPAA